MRNDLEYVFGIVNMVAIGFAALIASISCGIFWLTVDGNSIFGRLALLICVVLFCCTVICTTLLGCRIDLKRS